jgi:1-acyl-sn-glycerol-3-phosphate acyltransferase
VADLYGAFTDWAVRRMLPLGTRLGRFLFDVEITGQEHVPTGPVVFAANHFSHIDPPLVTVAVRGSVRYLAVDELYGRSRGFDQLMGFFGAIPTPRERPPFGALKTALRHLGDGGWVGLFPEGRRVEYWGENEPKRGAAWLSMRTGAPLVPVAIVGAEEILSLLDDSFHRMPVRIWVEAPLLPDSYLDRVDPLGAMMQDWRDAIDRRLQLWSITAETR